MFSNMKIINDNNTLVSMIDILPLSHDYFQHSYFISNTFKNVFIIFINVIFL